MATSAHAAYLREPASLLPTLDIDSAVLGPDELTVDETHACDNEADEGGSSIEHPPVARQPLQDLEHQTEGVLPNTCALGRPIEDVEGPVVPAALMTSIASCVTAVVSGSPVTTAIGRPHVGCASSPCQVR
jgi:hypothetical protein